MFADTQVAQPHARHSRFSARTGSMRVARHAGIAQASSAISDRISAAAVSVVDPILNPDGPLCEYDRGSWGPAEAARIAAHIGGWIGPTIAGA